MILLTFLRMAARIWIEARAMQCEAMRRYPHLRGSRALALAPLRTLTEVPYPC
jgi:hypothetical protein